MPPWPGVPAMRPCTTSSLAISEGPSRPGAPPALPGRCQRRHALGLGDAARRDDFVEDGCARPEASGRDRGVFRGSADRLAIHRGEIGAQGRVPVLVLGCLPHERGNRRLGVERGDGAANRANLRAASRSTRVRTPMLLRPCGAAPPSPAMTPRRLHRRHSAVEPARSLPFRRRKPLLPAPSPWRASSGGCRRAWNNPTSPHHRAPTTSTWKSFLKSMVHSGVSGGR